MKTIPLIAGIIIALVSATLAIGGGCRVADCEEKQGGLKIMNGAMDYKYRLPVEIGAGKYERYDKSVEINVNFTEQLKNLGVARAFDRNSIRVVEVDSSGKTLDEAVAYQFDEAPGYDAATNASGTVIFILKGTTPADAKRRFHIYFGDTTSPGKAPEFPVRVSVTEIDEYEGEETYRIATENATYYYHKHGSGFASMIDSDGNDWISFHPTAKSGAKGEYRGIPNIAPADFHPGRGDGKLPSEIVSRGALKIRIRFGTEDGKWGGIWDIYPKYATMTLLKKGDKPYWILYEGTPGGRFDLKDYWVHSSGERLPVAEYYMSKNQWQSKLPSPKWVYFGDGGMDRVLYLALHEGHDVEDQFWHFGDGGMTVFGFGRGLPGENWQQLTRVPAHLTIGFAENGDFEVASKVINCAYQELDITIGSAERLSP